MIFSAPLVSEFPGVEYEVRCFAIFLVLCPLRLVLPSFAGFDLTSHLVNIFSTAMLTCFVTLRLSVHPSGHWALSTELKH